MFDALCQADTAVLTNIVAGDFCFSYLRVKQKPNLDLSASVKTNQDQSPNLTKCFCTTAKR